MTSTLIRTGMLGYWEYSMLVFYMLALSQSLHSLSGWNSYLLDGLGIMSNTVQAGRLVTYTKSPFLTRNQADLVLLTPRVSFEQPTLFS
jgi:hypothetical protein